jgi:predicted ATPase/class 3 adenylate cyclase/DNA-binding CsgD family transcriptional regulator
MATTETVTVLFTDMVGSTGLLERLGPDAAERHRREHMARLRAAVAGAGGREIKNLGDGLMVTFGSAAAGVACALDMQRRIDASAGDPEAGSLRVGISAGDAEVDGSDYFGAPVVEAARLCDTAAGGEILATELVRLLAGERGSHTYAARGPLDLKGFDRPVPVVEVRPDPGAGSVATDGLDIPLPGLLALASPHPFVAREPEWETLEATWATSSRGARQAVLVGGESGAGKTRLVTEFARAVHRRGGLVLFGACSEEFELPYRPFVEALDHVVATTDSEGGRELAGRGIDDLAKLLPHLGALAGDPAAGRAVRAPISDTDAERYRLHEAVAALVGAVARHRPVLLVLDDLHWADRPTVQLLSALLRSASLARTCVIANYRNAPADVGTPLREALPDLHRLPGVHRVHVSGFDRAGVGQYLAALADQEPDDDLAPLVDTLVASTDGNAFLISELWRHLVGTGRVAVHGGRWRVAGRLDDVESPEGVRDVVAQRLTALPATTRDLLEVASVAGSTFDVELVAAAHGTDPGAVLEALEPAIDSRFVEEAGRGALRFAHALVQQTIEESLAAATRRRLHLRVGEAMAARPGGGRLDQIAHHYLAAVPLAPSTEAVGYARRAARQAVGSVAYEHAVELLEAALPLTGDGTYRADILLDLAEARMKAGDTVASLDAAAHAATLARRHQDGDRLVRAAMTYEEATWRGAHFGADAERLVREALRHAPDATTTARLLACRSRALAFSGRDDEALARADEAIAFARRLGDDDALCQALLGLLMSRWTAETAAQQEDAAREAAVLAARLGDDEAQLYAIDKLLIAPMFRGDLDATRRILAEHEQLAPRVGQPLFLLLEAQVRATVSLGEGHLDESEAHAEAASEWAHLLPHAGGAYGVQLFEIRRQQGRLDEARPFVEAVARLGREAATWRAGLAALYAELDMRAEAAALLPDLVADDLAAVPRDSLWCGALGYLADAAVATGDREAAAVLYDAIVPYRGYALLTPPLSCHGAADRHLGRLSAVVGRRRDAVAHLEDAVAFDDGGGARTWAAHSRYELGRLLAGQDRGRDVVRARALLQDAHAAARDIGIPRLAERCRRELHALDAAPARSSPDEVGLTGREIGVLRLLADGCTNREVGAELSISQHTVANHVRAILLKTGSHNRTEAARWALRHGVVSDGDGATSPP